MKILEQFRPSEDALELNEQNKTKIIIPKFKASKLSFANATDKSISLGKITKSLSNLSHESYHLKQNSISKEVVVSSFDDKSSKNNLSNLASIKSDELNKKRTIGSAQQSLDILYENVIDEKEEMSSLDMD